MNTNDEFSRMQIEIAKNDALSKIDAASRKLHENIEVHKELISKTEIDLTKAIIEKSVSPINRAITLLGVIFSLLALTGGVYTYTVTSNLESTLEGHIKRQVETWLSFDSDKSKANLILEDYRSRALLDAYMIKVARERISEQGLRFVNFKEADQRRLLDIVKNPNSEDMDFHDALKLLSLSRGEWGFHRENDQIAIELRALFTKASIISTERKIRTLQVLHNDRGLLPIAESIIQDKNLPGYFRHQAFKMLSIYGYLDDYGVLALKYANENMKTSSDWSVLKDVSSYIAKKYPLGNEIQVYIEKINKLERDDAIPLKIQLLSSLLEVIPSKQAISFNPNSGSNENEINKVRDVVASLIIDLINSEVVLHVSDYDSKKFISISFVSISGMRSSLYFDNIERLLDDKLLILKIIRNSHTIKNRLVKFSKFFDVNYRGEQVISLGIEIDNKTTIKIKKNILPKIGSVIWIKHDQNSNGAMIRWLNQNSVQNFSVIEEFHASEAVKIILNYSKEYIAYKTPYDRLLF